MGTQEQDEAEADNAEPAQGSGKKAGNKKPRTEKQKTLRALRRLLTKVAVVAAAVVLLLTVVGGVFVSHDNNMYPAVGDGDLAITYKLDGYYNGDIVVYEADGKNRFGRVIAIPGDTIEIVQDGPYQLNGTTPYETIYFATQPAAGSNVKYPYTVKEGELFILNDFRDNVYDSRTLSGVSIENMKGKVVLLIRRRGF